VKEKLTFLTTAVLVVCAVVITGLNVRRELFPRHDAQGQRRQGAMVENWRELVGAPRLGSAAEVELVVFADYTCQYCRQLDAALDSLQSTAGSRVQVRTLHFPLQPTGPGFTAAVAFECAALQRRGPAYHRLLYANQDVLGVIPWDSLAVLAGVPDRDTFRTCIREERTAGTVRSDRTRGEALGISVTPTFLMNGRLYVGGSSYAELVGRIERASQSPG
jgi:protein-disulfide isomerase